MKSIGLYGTVGFLAIRDFPFGGESDLWSDVWPAWMDWFRGLSRRGKNERFAVTRRETRKRIASFKEIKYDFFCRDVISLYVYRQA